MAESVKGLDRLLRQMKAMPELVRAEYSRVLEENARELTAAIRRAAPYDDGALRASIDYRQGYSGQAAQLALRGGAGAETRAQAKGAAGLLWTVSAGNAEAFYARWVEFGSSGHGIGSGGAASASDGSGWHPGAAANPFFWPTVRLYQKRLKSRMMRAGRKAAKAAAAVS
jgi:HK97 gp10 family phage protein